jgi:hypothetical protein
LEVLSAPGGWSGIRISVAWDWRDVDFTWDIAGILWVLRTEFEIGYGGNIYHFLDLANRTKITIVNF